MLAARILPRLLSAVGEPQRALVASRRPHLALGSPQFAGIAAILLNEARLAAAVGDREVAIRAYEGYLLWRQDLEQHLIPPRSSARAELVQLLRGR